MEERHDHRHRFRHIVMIGQFSLSVCTLQSAGSASFFVSKWLLCELGQLTTRAAQLILICLETRQSTLPAAARCLYEASVHVSARVAVISVICCYIVLLFNPVPDLNWPTSRTLCSRPWPRPRTRLFVLEAPCRGRRQVLEDTYITVYHRSSCTIPSKIVTFEWKLSLILIFSKLKVILEKS